MNGSINRLLALGTALVALAASSAIDTWNDRVRDWHFILSTSRCGENGPLPLLPLVEQVFAGEYGLTRDEISLDLVQFAQREDVRGGRRVDAIEALSECGTTNCLDFLSSVWRNKQDPARLDAFFSALAVAAETDKLFAIVEEALTATEGAENNDDKIIRLNVLSQMENLCLHNCIGLRKINSDPTRKPRIMAVLFDYAQREPRSVREIDSTLCQIDAEYRQGQKRRDLLTAARQKEAEKSRSQDGLPDSPQEVAPQHLRKDAANE